MSEASELIQQIVVGANGNKNGWRQREVRTSPAKSDFNQGARSEWRSSAATEDGRHWPQHFRRKGDFIQNVLDTCMLINEMQRRLQR